MIFWVIRMTCIKYGMVINIARAHLSRHNIVHVLGSFFDSILVLVDVTLGYNGDATKFATDLG